MSRFVDGAARIGFLGALADTVLRLREAHCLDICVETGTFLGASARWAAGVFKQVITIEINPDFQKIAIERCAEYGNISFCLGDTRAILPGIVRGLRAPALFWFDAHPVIRRSDGVVMSNHGMPIVEELDAILHSPLRHVVLIDDAHLMDVESLMAMGDAGGYRTSRTDDVIVWAP